MKQNSNVSITDLYHCINSKKKHSNHLVYIYSSSCYLNSKFCIDIPWIKLWYKKYCQFTDENELEDDTEEDKWAADEQVESEEGIEADEKAEVDETADSQKEEL